MDEINNLITKKRINIKKSYLYNSIYERGKSVTNCIQHYRLVLVEILSSDFKFIATVS